MAMLTGTIPDELHMIAVSYLKHKVKNAYCNLDRPKMNLQCIFHWAVVLFDHMIV